MLLDEAIKRYRASPIIAHAQQRLARELVAGLYYHSAAHTDDVLTEVSRFELHDGLPDPSQELLAISAAYHDMGFVVPATDNESLGAELAINRSFWRSGSVRDSG
jgi:HD-GYP domain-containing protein (c-di-GMP phosphodiesterase class II)